MHNLDSTGLEPVYFSNGDPESPFAITKTKIQREPWMYSLYISEETQVQENERVSSSKRATLELLFHIIPPNPVPQITSQEFLTENDLFKFVKQYFSDDQDFTADKLNDLLDKDGSWGTPTQKGKREKRIRGRTYNVVDSSLRRFTWKDINAISQFRSLVKSTQKEFVNIGYVHKSKTTESLIAKKKYLDLQIYNLKNKALCKHVFSSVDTNPDALLEDRDFPGNNMVINIENSRGDFQGK